MEKSPFIKALNYGKPWCSVLIVYVNDFFTHTSSLIRLYYQSINFTHFKKITINTRWKRYRCREWVIMCRRSISFPSFLVTRFVLWKPRKKIHQCGFVGLWDFNNLSLHWKKPFNWGNSPYVEPFDRLHTAIHMDAIMCRCRYMNEPATNGCHESPCDET